MATLREAINTAKQEPNSERSRLLLQGIQSGKFDEIAVSEGIDISPLKTTVSETIKEEPKGFLGRVREKTKDIGVKEIVEGAKEGFSGAVERSQARTGQVRKDVMSGEATGGDVIRAGAEPVLGGLDLIFSTIGGGIGTMAEPVVQEAVEAMPEGAKEKLGELQEWYGGLDPERQQDIQRFLIGAETVTSFFGAPVASKIGKEFVETTAKEVKDVALKSAAETAKTGADILEQRAITQLPKVTEEAKRAAGQIVQGDPDDIDSALRSLRNIDTENVNSYEDLLSSVQSKITGVSEQQNELLAAADKVLTPAQATKKTTVGSETIEQNFVQKALDGLNELYGKTELPAEQARIRNIANKFETDGLTLIEINDLAKEFGMRRSGFSDATGNPLTSLNKQAYENIRKGLKATVRKELPTDASKQLDAEISDLINTRGLVEDMQKKANRLAQRVQERKLGEKLGRVAGQLLDTLTLGGAKGIVQTLTTPSGRGFKTLDALKLQDVIQENLKKIEKLNKLESDDSLVEGLREFSESINLRSAE